MMGSPKRLRLWLPACAAIITIAAAGCSASGPSGAPGSGSGGGSDSVTIALQVEPDSLDSCDTQTIKNGIITHGNVVQALTALQPTTKAVEPLLATSWTQQNPTTWIFKLRQNVKFSDGTPFNAAAAAFGIMRTQNPKLSCLNEEEFATPVTATAVNSYTLKVVTKEPDPVLPLRMSYIDLPSPKTPENAKAIAIGTGPYEITGWDHGQDVTLKRFSGYWGAKPQVTGAQYIFRTDPEVRADTAKTGEADIAIPTDPQDSTGNAQTENYTTSAVFFLRTETDRPPFNDVRVRQAVADAIDKNTIVSKLMTGFATPTSQMVVSSNNGYIPGYTGPSYDLAKAKSLIAAAKAAGVDTSKQVLLIYRSDLFPGADEVLQNIAADLNAAGLNIKVDAVDDTLWLKFLTKPFPASQQVDILATLHDNASGDAIFTFPKYITSSGTVSSTSDPKVDSLVSQASAAEGSKRASLFQQAALQLYTQDANIIPVAEVDNQLILAKGVTYKTNGLTSVELLLSDIHLSSS